MNPRITPRERGLLKGAVRRVFARSDLRHKVLSSADAVHSDDMRPRVKKWSRCQVCAEIVPRYLVVVDHIIPVIPIDSSFEEMGMDKTVDRMWCEEENLQPICPRCHLAKSKGEKDERKAFKRAGKDSSEGRTRGSAIKRSSKSA